MAEINLLQNRIHDTSGFAWKTQGRVVLAVFSALLVLFALGGGGLWFLNNKISGEVATVSAKNQELQTQLNEKQGQLGDAKTYQAQLSNLRSLLGNHVYITPLLDEIAKLTYVKAQYNTIDASDSGVVHLEGKVSDYASLAKLMLGLNTSSNFKNVRLLSVTPSSGKVNAYVFAIEFSVPSTIFTKK
jgi:Tfp pilus assembly protein PilN